MTNARPARDISLDVIRILACLMVVTMHSPIPDDGAVGPFLSALSYVTAPCIGLFFMVSGALLLPVRTGYFTFLRRRFSKIVVPTLIWSLVYLAFNLYYSESEINIFQQIVSLPLTNTTEGVLWFMYTLAGLYLLAPILSAWAERASRAELRLVLGLWTITICYPLFEFGLLTNNSTSGILYYFTGYAGYFLLGYYMRRFPSDLSGIGATVIAASGVLLMLALKHFGVAFNFYQLFWYESIFIAALGLSIWKGAKRLLRQITFKRGVISVISTISGLTFGVYLIHILIMRRWLWNMDAIQSISNYALQTLIVAGLTFVFSLMACWLLAKLPFAQWLIAYKS